MKLQRLTLKNFRQFYGEQVLHFSTSSQQNVTIIHGENGAGKTSLLNAFKWAFYGETDFDTGNQNIVNERAIVEATEGDEIHCSVRVDFEHEGCNYFVTREFYCVKDTGIKCYPKGGSIVELTEINDKGEFNNPSNPETRIDQLLPQKLHSYFFFNGERIEKLANIESSSEIQRAIKSLMGLEIVERASRHIGTYVLPKFKKDLKQHSTQELAEIIDEEGQIENEAIDIKRELEDTVNNHKHFQTIRNEIERNLKEIEEAASLQKRREIAKQKLNEYEQRLDNLKKERMQSISRIGFLAFTQSLLDKTKSILDEKRRKGELPSKIKSQFIDDLLSNKLCICGRPLEDGSDAHNKVTSYKTSSVTNDIEDAFIKTSGSVIHMENERRNLIDRIKEFQKREKEIEDDKQRLNEEVDEVDGKLGNSKIEDIVNLQNKRREIEAKIDELNRKIGELKHKFDKVNENLEKIQKKRKELDAKDRESVLIKQKLELAEEVKKIIDTLHDALSDMVRKELSTKVDKTFRSILVKDYWAEISEDYTLQIYKKIGEHKHLVSNKSTGESQVSSLSFIGSIVSLAKERYDQNTGYYKGGLYPIVMDSPYGNLDPEYRKKIAKHIPELAEQVIVMVTNSQWRGEVEDTIKTRVGKRYSLIYHTPNKKNNVNTNIIVQDTKYEYTEIKEGYYD